MVEYISDRVAVMYLGEIVERAGAGSCTAIRCTPIRVRCSASVPTLDPARGGADRAGGRRAQSDQSALRLPLPSALPAGHAGLPRGPPRLEFDRHLVRCHAAEEELLGTGEYELPQRRTLSESGD